MEVRILYHKLRFEKLFDNISDQFIDNNQTLLDKIIFEMSVILPCKNEYPIFVL